MVDTYRADNYDELVATATPVAQTKVIDSDNVEDTPIFDEVSAESKPKVTTKSKG